MSNRRRIALACAVAAVLMLGSISIAASDSLEKGFLHPPDSAKPQTWWHWMNGNISREGITADLEAMKRVGVGGAQIFNVDCGIPPGPVKFMSPEWIGMVKHAVSEADRLGLELCIHNCAGWSSSGGPWITPELAMQEPVWAERQIKGPSHFSEVLPQPQSRENYYRDIAVLAFRSESLPDNGEQISDVRGKAAFDRRDRMDPDLSTPVAGGAIPLDGVIDITKYMASDGRLTWDVPDGQWSILRIGYRPTGARNAPAAPEGRGLECDKLSKEALDAHWAGMMGPVLKALGPAAGRSLNNVLIDSYEMGHQNWTPKFREEFAKRCGYDILPFLPVITGRVVGSPEISERFLWDFRRTIADMYAENYYGHMSELCHANGMKSSNEPYGNATFDNLQCGGKADIAMGEFWVGGGAEGTTKMASSAMHTNGGKITGAESFTAVESRGRWLVDPYSIKALGDQIYCNGVNRFIMHRYAMQPWLNVAPGMTMGPWGTNFERTVTWWNQGAGWLSYLARCQSMLQSGLFCADVCYFYGESGANDLSSRASLRPTLPAGYDYDGCASGVVLQRMSVRDGRIVLPDGMSYRILVLPESQFMTPKMLDKIAQLVKAGATVVGPKPTKSPSLSDYPDCDARVGEIADQIWGNCDGATVKEHAFGLGRVVWGMDLAGVFAQMRIKPDFATPGKTGKDRLNWIHRKVGETDAYFVANRGYSPVSIECSFRQAGKVPEFWSPDTGKITDAPIYREVGGTTTVPIRFDPAGSVFVVFRKPVGKSHHLVSATRAGGTDAASVARIPRIVKATYGAAGDANAADVTDKVAAMVANAQLIIPANNDSYGDTAPLVVKQLTVEYVIDGKTHAAIVSEGGQLDLTMGGGAAMPEFEVEVGKHNSIELKAWKPGVYTLKTADGKVRQMQVKTGAATREIAGPWTLRFPDGWGAPKQVGLDKLISWTEHSDPGVRYFSGTARYSKDFDVPASMVGSDRSVVLDLGKVMNFAEVTLNGKKLAVLWKEPFRADVTGLMRAGRNHLEVSVTNLWPNRIIGDEQYPDDCQWNGNTIAQIPQWVTGGGTRPQKERYTFATWKFYNKDSKLLESGLLGPVVLYSAKRLRPL